MSHRHGGGNGILQRTSEWTVILCPSCRGMWAATSVTNACPSYALDIPKRAQTKRLKEKAMLALPLCGCQIE